MAALLVPIRYAIFRVKGPEWVIAWYLDGDLPFRDPCLFALRMIFN